ncbi:amidohydrolase family protein [Pseudoduganella eburnea]|uniref:Amidohydrolase family protein n=1 Tax=Massilia eburnea TaxID=1776165 RepID=A0A6L6QQ49_9BURK|nr:amidohydrolase family protein [Massilia eburnea]MTW14489.1 amidohydrolase family protein [Massilia eburnea]
MSRTLLTRCSIVGITCLLPLSVLARPKAPVAEAAVEQGKFILHKFAQPIGLETWQITRQPGGYQLTDKFEFKDRGTPVPLTMKFAYDKTGTPQSFNIKGKNSRLSEIDQKVLVNANTVRVQVDGADRTLEKPKAFFPIAGYAPTAQQLMLMRYWINHGKPAALRTLPSGTVQIAKRGQDRFTLDGKPVLLDRYLVTGLIWGRETIWLDQSNNLVALVSIDAEFDHFESVREGFQSLLPSFLSKAGEDEMASMKEFAGKASSDPSKTLALVGGTLIDATGKPAIPDSVVVIANHRIVAAGPRAQVAIPDGATRVDTTGKTIMPGLWDMHAHFEQVEWGPIYLAAGVTTVRDCGNEFEFITAVRDELAKGNGIGPQLLPAGLVDGTGEKSLGVQRVDSDADAQKWVRKYHDAGFRQMKVYSSMTRENVASVARYAHQLGMSVTGHIPSTMGLVEGVEAGMDQVNHIVYLYDAMQAEGKSPMSKGLRKIKLEDLKSFSVASPEAQKTIEFMKAHHIVVDPTMALWEVVTRNWPSTPIASFEPGVSKLPPELSVSFAPPAEEKAEDKEKMELAFQRMLEIVGALHKAGIDIVAGTDQAIPGHSIYRELELYVKAGFTPLEALQSATSVPARVMGMDKETGTIEAGKRADIIILDANPLEEIKNIRSVDKVIANGVMYDAAPLWKSVGFKP